jgi:hypothetical protein
VSLPFGPSGAVADGGASDKDRFLHFFLVLVFLCLYDFLYNFVFELFGILLCYFLFSEFQFLTDLEIMVKHFLPHHIDVVAGVEHDVVRKLHIRLFIGAEMFEVFDEVDDV